MCALNYAFLGSLIGNYACGMLFAYEPLEDDGS